MVDFREIPGRHPCKSPCWKKWKATLLTELREEVSFTSKRAQQTYLPKTQTKHYSKRILLDVHIVLKKIWKILQKKVKFFHWTPTHEGMGHFVFEITGSRVESKMIQQWLAVRGCVNKKPQVPHLSFWKMFKGRRFGAPNVKPENDTKAATTQRKPMTLSLSMSFSG